MLPKKLAMLTAIAVSLVFGVPRATAQKMYWAEFGGTSKIQRANLDGSNVELIYEHGAIEGAGPYGVALDLSQRKVYWLVGDAGGIAKIWRASMDPPYPDPAADFVLSGLFGPDYIDVDDDAGKLFWTHDGIDKIQRANLDGSNVANVVTGVPLPIGIALDLTARKVYWTEHAPAIKRADMDGTDSNVEPIPVTGLVLPYDIDVDTTANLMCWADAGQEQQADGRIVCADLDGNNVEDCVLGLDGPFGIALDVAAGKVYWTDFDAGKIGRANLDCTGVEELLAGLDAPYGIALDSANITVEFQQGPDYSDAVDTHFHEGHPDTDNCTEPWLRWDTNGGPSPYGEYQSLLRFGALFTDNGGPIPSGNPSLIVNATLYLQGSDESGDPALLHRMLQDWSCPTTWNDWGGDGVQAGEEAAASHHASVPPDPGEMAVDVTASLVAWAEDPSQNFGWVFLPTGPDGFSVDSSDAEVQAVRPRLEVTFTPKAPAIPTVSEWGMVALTLLLVSAGTVVFRARRTADW